MNVSGLPVPLLTKTSVTRILLINYLLPLPGQHLANAPVKPNPAFEVPG